MKTYKANETMFIVDGEIYVGFIPHPNAYGIINFTIPTLSDSKTINASYSTKQLEGVKLIDRSLFVKPVDIESKAREIFDNSHMNLSTDFLIGYRFGYTDNKSEFTKEDMIEAMKYAALCNISLRGILSYIDNYKPLNLPESITIDDNDNITEVKW